MSKTSLSKTIALFTVLCGLASQVSCKSGAGSTASSGSTSRADYPFDENGNYRPEFLAANGGSGEVIDLTKDNPRSSFIASNDGWSASSPSSSSTSRKTAPAPRSSGRSVASAKPKPKAPAKPAAKPKPKAPAPKYASHTIGKGDTLYSLGRRYGVSAAAIQAANGMGSSTTLREGKSVRIPKK